MNVQHNDSWIPLSECEDVPKPANAMNYFIPTNIIFELMINVLQLQIISHLQYSIFIQWINVFGPTYAQFNLLTELTRPNVQN